MSVEPIGLVVMALGALTLLCAPGFGMAIFVQLMLLGAAGAVLLGGSGTIQPAHLMLGFVILAALGRLDWTAARHSLRFPGPGFWLAAFTLVAVVSAAFLPRLLARSTEINAVGSTEYGPSVLLVPLGPTSGNLTQSIYVVADLACFLLCLAFAGRPDGFKTLARALAVYCGLNIAFAVVDLATFWTDTGYLLAPIRNAEYDLHVETVTTGMKRIVGSFVEASSFAGTTLGTLGFAARLALAGVRPRIFGAVALASFGFLVFSTSSTAFVAGPALLVCLYAGAVRRAARGWAAPLNYAALALIPAAVVVFISGVALAPHASAVVGGTLDSMLFDKADSESGLARAAWNATALQNVVDTGGLGTGLGSVRASSFPVALLANTGVAGAALMAVFLLTAFARTRPADELDPTANAVRDAARMACIGLLLGGTVSGTMADLGLPFFVFAALACAPAVRTGVAPAPAVPRPLVRQPDLIVQARPG